MDIPDGSISRLYEAFVKVKIWEGKLDVYLPPFTNNKPSGIVINIHGGGWKMKLKHHKPALVLFSRQDLLPLIYPTA